VKIAIVDIVLRCVFSTLQQHESILMSTRNVSVLIGPNTSLNVKLWAFFIATIEQTGASGTWVSASPEAHHMTTHRLRFEEKGCKNRSEVFQGCRSFFHRQLQEME
jgi:hypothetical protein